MADRYGYVSFVGLFIALCWGIADWAEALERRADFAARRKCCHPVDTGSRPPSRQISYWTDDLTFWTHTAEAVSNNAMAENVIGETLQQKGEREEAMSHFRAAAAMDPLFPFPYLHIGIYDEEHRHPQEAIEQLQKVIDLTQGAAEHMPAIRTEAFVHMSFAYAQLGDRANQEKYLNLAAQQNQTE